MKYVLVLLFSANVAFGGYGGESYSGALREAATAGKPLMVEFYTTWCKYCKIMDKQVYEIPGTLDKFIYWHVDAERYTALAAQYRVNGYPTVVFLTPDGKEFHRFSGTYDTASVLKEVLEREVLPKAGDLKPTLKPVPAELSPADQGAQEDLRKARGFFSVGKDMEAAEAYRQILAKYPGTAAATEAQTKLKRLGQDSQTSR